MSNVAIIGAGYVGLTTAACLAHIGHNVTCADIDENKISRLNDGEIPIHEARLPELVQEGLSNQLLKFVVCLLYTSPSPRDRTRSRMPSSA